MTTEVMMEAPVWLAQSKKVVDIQPAADL